MRYSSTTLGPPTAGGAVTVTPLSGSSFLVSTLANTFNAGSAFESILGMLASAHAYGASIVGTAAAANKAIAELNNPNASGKTLWVYEIDLFVPTAMAVNLFLDGTTLSPATTPSNLLVGGAAGVAKVGGGNQLTPTGSLVHTSPSITANTQYQIPQPWVIGVPANHNLQLQGQTVNQAFTCNVRWFEL